MAMPTVDLEGFSIRSKSEGKVLFIAVTGIADIDAQDVLGDYFTQVHAETQQVGLTEVVVDIRDLSFINSNCLKAFVSWISLVSRTPQANRYRIRIIRDPKRRWQERSFDALQRMSLSVVILEDEDGTAP